MLVSAHYKLILLYHVPLADCIQSSTAMEWVIDDVSSESQRGTCERLRRKLGKIRETLCQKEPKPVYVAAQTQDELKRLKEALQVAQEKEKEMSDIHQELKQNVKQLEAVKEATLQDLHELRDVTAKQLIQSESDRQLAIKRAEQAEQERDVASRQATVAEERTRVAEERAAEAGEELRKVERQWIIKKEEICITSIELGRGGWAVVKVAEFRGTQVAAKCFYRELRSKYYEQMFAREMKMASRLRHPNLVQFIGATSLTEGEPIILTELMTTSLRELLKEGPLEHSAIVSISLDVTRALNYLHLMDPHPLIHRDISSANVLLDPVPTKGWKAKVADYGSVNLVQKLQTVGPGNPTYAAPEATIPTLQSPKMDIFSFGILLVEMLTDQFPEEENRSQLITSIGHSGFTVLIKKCLHRERDKRPSAEQLLDDLSKVL